MPKTIYKIKFESSNSNSVADKRQTNIDIITENLSDIVLESPLVLDEPDTIYLNNTGYRVKKQKKSLKVKNGDLVVYQTFYISPVISNDKTEKNDEYDDGFVFSCSNPYDF
jgi:hypothetical protein